jgi:branched-chain amino acid transport system substrate-binding protein
MRTYLGRAVAALAILAIASCSLIVQRDGVQCNVDGDCSKRGPAFANSKCDTMQHVCIAACNVNGDCNMQPAVCKASQCVQLLSTECDRTIPVLMPGQAVDDNAIVLGGILSLQGTNQSSGIARLNSIQLGIEGVAREVVGLPGGMNGKPRPLLAVACTDTDAANNDVSLKAAQHLIDIGAAAIMGPGSSGLVLNVAKTVTIPQKEFLITPSATSRDISGLSPYLWRTAPSDVIQAIPLVESIKEIEAKYRVDNMIPMTTQLKLAIVYKGDSYGGGLFSSVAGNAKINGLPVTDPMNTANFKGTIFDPMTTDFSSIVTDLANFKPNIIALFGTSEVDKFILSPLETAWPMMVLRPAYLISDGGRKQELLDAVKMFGDPLRLRIRGTVPGVQESSSQLFKLFRLNYQSKFQSTPACPNMICPDIFGMAGAYDSVYLLALSIVSLGSQPITGDGMAAGMAKTVGGTKYQIGMDKLQDAINTIGSGKPLDVDGASGPLDFDVMAHEAASDIQVWCVSGGDFYTTGRFYSATTKAMGGVFSCP